jgi:AraC-like DNA-binding protein
VPVVNSLEEIEGDVRFHHLTPELWVLEARRCARRWVVYHETYSFCLCTGVTENVPVPWRYNHQTYRVDENHAMIMQPGELHANVARTPPADFIVVQIADALVKRVAWTLGWKGGELNVPHPHPGTEHPAILTALKRIRSRLCSDLFPTDGKERCSCGETLAEQLENVALLISALVAHCAEGARCGSMPRRGAAIVNKALRHLRANFREGYDLQRLAEAAGCDPHYLIHAFTQEIGIPPSTYQNRMLVAKTARALVQAPRRPLQLIAQDVGWPGRRDGKATDTPADRDRTGILIRHFKRAMGITPDQFRANIRRS